MGVSAKKKNHSTRLLDLFWHNNLKAHSYSTVHSEIIHSTTPHKLSTDGTKENYNITNW